MERGCKRMCWSSAMQSKFGSGMAETAIHGGEEKVWKWGTYQIVFFVVVFFVFVLGFRACFFRDLEGIVAFLLPIL